VRDIHFEDRIEKEKGRKRERKEKERERERERADDIHINSCRMRLFF